MAVIPSASIFNERESLVRPCFHLFQEFMK